MTIKTYSDLRSLRTLKDRYDYLALHGDVGRSTFGFDRYLNQKFYTSTQWRHVRNQIIVRDNGCDLGINGYEIHDRVYIHHMNPISVADIIEDDPKILDPEFLIVVTHRTHNAIHYGDANLLPQPFVERRPGDTRLW